MAPCRRYTVDPRLLFKKRHYQDVTDGTSPVLSQEDDNPSPYFNWGYFLLIVEIHSLHTMG